MTISTVFTLWVMVWTIAGVILLVGALALIVIFCICQTVGKDFKRKLK